METYTFLKGRQNNKLCSFKKFDFSNRKKKKSGMEGVFFLIGLSRVVKRRVFSQKKEKKNQ